MKFDLPGVDNEIDTSDPTGSVVGLGTLAVGGMIVAAGVFASRDGGQFIYNKITGALGVAANNAESGVDL